MTLRLVGAKEPPKPHPPRRKYERTPLLSPDEEKRFRAALKALKNAFGTTGCLAAAMGVTRNRLCEAMRGRFGVTGDVIIRAMRASGLSYDDLMGAPVLAGTCRACGAVKRVA